MPGDRAVGGVVSELRQDRQRADPRQNARREAQIDNADREAGHGSAPSASHAGSVERQRPAEREGEMNGDRSGEQPAAPRLAGQQDRARCERRLERVASGRKRVER